MAVQTSLSSHIMSCFSGHLSNISTDEICIEIPFERIWNNSARPFFFFFVCLVSTNQMGLQNIVKIPI